jgi:hypothetical protein
MNHVEAFASHEPGEGDERAKVRERGEATGHRHREVGNPTGLDLRDIGTCCAHADHVVPLVPNPLELIQKKIPERQVHGGHVRDSRLVALR